jgi:hypothetical protein
MFVGITALALVSKVHMAADPSQRDIPPQRRIREPRELRATSCVCTSPTMVPVSLSPSGTDVHGLPAPW